MLVCAMAPRDYQRARYGLSAYDARIMPWGGWAQTPSRGFFLTSGAKIGIPMRKKVAARRAFPLSMHVVLKTMYVNPKDYARRF